MLIQIPESLGGYRAPASPILDSSLKPANTMIPSIIHFIWPGRPLSREQLISVYSNIMKKTVDLNLLCGRIVCRIIFDSFICLF